jgi:glycosyltransferase involved in cell wall biosynthesis
VDLRKFHVLPNSFDPDDFADITETSTPQNKFIISHAGTFYGNRSPASFLQALTKLLDQKPHWRDRIEIFFIGSLPQNGISLDYLNLLKDVVRFVPCLPYQEMLKFLMRSTLLLLIPGPGEGTITGKVFDYLALKKPIFLLSEGNVSLENILRKTKNGIILSYHDVDRIAESLSFFIQEFFRDGTIEMELNEEEIHFFTSIEMARKFSRMMDEILKIDREIHRA